MLGRELVLPAAQQCGVPDRVSTHPMVPYRQSIQIQRAPMCYCSCSDDPRSRVTAPQSSSSIWQCLRPILGIGWTTACRNHHPSTPGRFFSNDPRQIAEQLRRWLDVKGTQGRIAPLPDSAEKGCRVMCNFGIWSNFVRN